jgi:hypothetical protein
MIYMRTVVLTIAYDPDMIRDPAEWLASEINPRQPHHYAVIGAMCPVAEALPIRGCDKLAQIEHCITEKCVMPTATILDINGNPV